MGTQKAIIHTHETNLKPLRATQLTVGLSEVLLKRQHWRALDKTAQHAFLGKNPLPAVIGPKNKHYIIDHHHLGMALLLEGVDCVQLMVVTDFSTLTKDEFWTVMEHRQWVHPYDARGRRQPYSMLPKSLVKLADDPYRSLAAAVRMAGGYVKVATPFAEFLWADFFRRRVSAKQLRTEPGAALAVAMDIVHDKIAIHLPGWFTTPVTPH